MQFVDTHTHIYLQDEFAGEYTEVAKRAFEAGVTHLIFPNVDRHSVAPMMRLHDCFPMNTSVAMGLHPTEINESWKDELAYIREILDTHRFVAIGEVGIDMYWDKTFRTEQMQALDIQLHWAEEKHLPVIIHCRDGLNEIVEVLENYSGKLPEIVFHSFTGNVDDVNRLRKISDFYFGINGVVTFKNAQSLRDALPTIGLNRILLETDSPYLAPVPYRGKRNESAYIPLIAQKIAETLAISVEEVASTTTANAIGFFNLKLQK